MQTFWWLWDHGMNWFFFVTVFLLIEGVSLANHHFTLSESFWAALRHPAWGLVLTLGFQALALVLFVHLIGGGK